MSILSLQQSLPQCHSTRSIYDTTISTPPPPFRTRPSSPRLSASTRSNTIQLPKPRKRQTRRRRHRLHRRRHHSLNPRRRRRPRLPSPNPTPNPPLDHNPLHRIAKYPVDRLALDGPTGHRQQVHEALEPGG